MGMDPRDKKLKLYCKGADSVIAQRLKKTAKQKKEWQQTLKSLQVFAADGLRTLVCAYKELQSKDFVEWLQKLNKAKSAMENRDILVEACYDEIERDLTLLGATAIL